MDRAAKLAAFAADRMKTERTWMEVDAGLFAAARHTTRTFLAYRAERLGFAPNEISAAIDEALTAAGATP